MAHEGIFATSDEILVKAGENYDTSITEARINALCNYLIVEDSGIAHVPCFGSDEVTDVTGAGDTVIAVLSSALAAGASSLEAVHLANIAGGLVVQKQGTATLTRAELIDAISRWKQ